MSRLTVGNAWCVQVAQRLKERGWARGITGRVKPIKIPLLLNPLTTNKKKKKIILRKKLKTLKL